MGVADTRVMLESPLQAVELSVHCSAKARTPAWPDPCAGQESRAASEVASWSGLGVAVSQARTRAAGKKARCLEVGTVRCDIPG
ncbi:MAG: hypothetical protein HYV07_11145 [Deltaproteobacteria bacterium]|nr:hypothetical protein [Deltaproteobacteria bacterium]